MSEIIIDSALNYSDFKKSTSAPEYKYQNITPISPGGSAPVLSLTANTQVTFEIPSRVVNLARSYITFNTLAALISGEFTNTAGTGQPWINSISLQTRTGEYLCNINQAQNYFFATALPCRDLDNYLTTDIVNPTIETVAAITDTFVGVSRTSLADMTPDKQLSSTDQLAQAIKHVIKFSDLFHTIFAVNKNIPLNQILTLTLNLSYVNGAMYQSTGNTTGEADGKALAAIPTVSGLTLSLCCETNQSIIDGLYSKINSGEGLKMNIPYVYSWRNAFTNNQDSTTQVRLNNSMGQNLLRIYNTVMSSTENFALKYRPNYSDLTSLRTYINNVPTTDNDLNKYDIYNVQKDLFKGSAMLSSSVFAAWMTYIDNFSKYKPSQSQEGDLVSDGKPLSNELLYSFRRTATTGTDVQFIHAVVQRVLSIGSSEIMIR